VHSPHFIASKAFRKIVPRESARQIPAFLPTGRNPHSTNSSGTVGKSSVATLVLASILAGSAIAIQAPINAQLRTWLASPWAAAFASFLVGTITLGCIFLLSTHSFRLTAVSAAPLWVWTGGLLGAYYVVAAIVATPRIGPALFFGLLVTGQLVTAIVVEHFGWLGLERHPISAGRLVGVVLLIVGAVLIRRF